MGDKGYIGVGMITPTRKPVYRSLADEEKYFNRQVNQVLYQIERTIANLKTWRILHTGYRRRYETFTDTIAAIIGLEFHRQAF
ncbi:transposase family protein [Specibacter cremeus]|uniref:transposase family protein n=1 Tax=Specibacter cremeus TaxID=1629051 RepID=UPI003B836BF5